MYLLVEVPAVAGHLRTKLKCLSVNLCFTLNRPCTLRPDLLWSSFFFLLKLIDPGTPRPPFFSLLVSVAKLQRDRHRSSVLVHALPFCAQLLDLLSVNPVTSLMLWSDRQWLCADFSKKLTIDKYHETTDGV